EIADNREDDDGNGYVDDLHGWNFLGGDNQLINLEHRDVVSDNVIRLNEIIEKKRIGRANEEELAWFEKKMRDGILKAKFILAGPYSHGTHVADVAGRDLPGLKLMPIRLIHVGLSVEGSRAVPQQDANLTVLRNYLKGGFAEDYAKKFRRITSYLKSHGVDIANGSYGMGYSTLQRITSHFYYEIYKQKPQKQEVEVVTQFLAGELAKKCNSIIGETSDTLFIYAAGNDSSNNDHFPTFPTNTMAENEISVAATYEDVLLAPFSNYGPITVDVAAPGVFIKAAVPGGKEMYMSGTSMAAPYVTNVAAKIKAINDNLVPRDIKVIIMETVDIKPFLQSKVKSGGIVNMERAVIAAQYSVNNDLVTAIQLAKQEVRAKNTRGMGNETMSRDSEYLVPMPSMIDLKML
ncbi:MAG: S8 family serine peptidase, partial [Desulfobulbaceae bacterium]|nr:S8 family serine peptidase [Desulfobulbaceae bacterium]